jgi:hypothetical protein
MPHDPKAQFDLTVLDLIEHSPTGAVPATPSYLDALKRLLHSHQVYASANHKGCYVTARSLATAPTFFAKNLDDVLAGKIDAAELESNFSIFERYVQAMPAAHKERAESFRTLVAGKPAHHRAKHVGDQVIVEGLQKVRPGAPASPVPFKAVADAPAGGAPPAPVPEDKKPDAPAAPKPATDGAP